MIEIFNQITIKINVDFWYWLQYSNQLSWLFSGLIPVQKLIFLGYRLHGSFERIYVSIKTFVWTELLRRHHDDELTKHFEIKKTLKLFVRKYHWSNINIYVKSYVNICEICQRTKTSRHRFYKTLQSLFQSNNSWKKIIMNFITNFSSNKHKNHVYDVCLMIVNKYTKMILYIFITKKFNVVNLIEILFEKIVLMFETSTNIVFDRKSIFTNAYWSIICFHLKTKRRFSIVFHFQINEQIERQNQTLKHYFRMYYCDK